MIDILTTVVQATSRAKKREGKNDASRITNNFSLWLRTVRKRHRPRITLPQLGALAGVDWTIIQKAETEVRRWDMDLIIKVIAGLAKAGIKIELNEALKRAGLPLVDDALQPLTQNDAAITLPLPMGGVEVATNHDWGQSDVEDRNTEERERTNIKSQLNELLRLAMSDDVSPATRRILLAHVDDLNRQLDQVEAEARHRQAERARNAANTGAGNSTFNIDAGCSPATA